MTTIVDTNYRPTGAGNLLSYLEKDDEQYLRNRRGERMTSEEIQEFIDESDRRDFNRMITISPENRHELSDDELSLHTRRTMREFTEDKNSATYCYAIHRDTDDPHVQVAMTGSKSDLYMDVEDIKSVERDAHDKFLSRSHEQEQERERQRQREREQEQEREREHQQDEGVGL